MVRVISFEVVQLAKTTQRNTSITTNLFIIKSIYLAILLSVYWEVTTFVVQSKQPILLQNVIFASYNLPLARWVSCY